MVASQYSLPLYCQLASFLLLHIQQEALSAASPNLYTAFFLSLPFSPTAITTADLAGKLLHPTTCASLYPCSPAPGLCSIQIFSQMLLHLLVENRTVSDYKFVGTASGNWSLLFRSILSSHAWVDCMRLDPEAGFVGHCWLCFLLDKGDYRCLHGSAFPSSCLL